MAINYRTVSERVFNILKGFGFAVRSFDKYGEAVIDPRKATRFAVAKPNVLIRIDDQDESISLSTSADTDDDDLRTMLKNLATDHLMNFDYKRFARKLKPKSERIDVERRKDTDMDSIAENHQVTNQTPEIMEGFGQLTGSSKTSYQDLGNIRIIVKHRSAVNEEMRGARSRNIRSIYLQRGGERFRVQENNLRVARALARHLHQGGEMHDSTGAIISEMASEYKKLGTFVQYVKRSGLINENNQDLVETAQKSIQRMRETFHRLTGIKTYATAVESLEMYTQPEMLEDDVDLESKFTRTSVDNRVSDAISALRSVMGRERTFQESIQAAIKQEDFSGLKNQLSENSGLEFSSPHAQLGWQVGQMAGATTNTTLRNHLNGISKKLSSGGSLDQFEYGTVKSCLLGANEAQVRETVQVTESVDTSCMKNINAWLDSFHIPENPKR
jgi:hypothetical protein